MRVAVISDIHANLEAFEAVLAHIETQGVDAYWFLGDAVGYGADPEIVVQRTLQLHPLTSVRGNHDKVVAGLEEPYGFSRTARDAALRTRELISEATRATLAALPPGPVVVSESIALCHGSWFDENYYILSTHDAAETLLESPTQLLFFGHTHRACLYAQTNGYALDLPIDDGSVLTLKRDVRYLLNPGSVGQPRDRDPRAAYVLFDTDEWTAVFHRIVYDVETAQRKIFAAGLPEINAFRLSEGR